MDGTDPDLSVVSGSGSDYFRRKHQKCILREYNRHRSTTGGNFCPDTLSLVSQKSSEDALNRALLKAEQDAAEVLQTLEEEDFEETDLSDCYDDDDSDDEEHTFFSFFENLNLMACGSAVAFDPFPRARRKRPSRSSTRRRRPTAKQQREKEFF